MPTLILVRGLPGSGKSTLAKRLRAKHFESDKFFIKKGEYKFDPTKLKEAHAWCQHRVNVYMLSGHPVVVSNTFTQYWEIKPYLYLAKQHNYDIQIIECHGKWESVHNVPEEALVRMKERWEPTSTWVY